MIHVDLRIARHDQQAECSKIRQRDQLGGLSTLSDILSDIEPVQAATAGKRPKADEKGTGR